MAGNQYFLFKSWFVMLCSNVVGYQHFGGPSCLHLHPDGGGSKVLCNAGILHHYTVSQPNHDLKLHYHENLISHVTIFFINKSMTDLCKTAYIPAGCSVLKVPVVGLCANIPQ
jgi:hypothetical protein